jgi:predicted protein tyrosine phosphatase
MIKAHRNQLGVAKNTAQGKALRVLCVCSAGVLRSPTLANYLHKEWGYNTRACGSSEEYALIPLSEALIEWADTIIFVNEENYVEALFRNQPLAALIEKKTIVLDIPDNYDYNDPTLVSIMHQQFTDAWNSQ